MTSWNAVYSISMTSLQWMEDAFLARKAVADGPQLQGNNFVPRLPPQNTFYEAEFNELDVISGKNRFLRSDTFLRGWLFSFISHPEGPLPIKSIARSRDSTIGQQPFVSTLQYENFRQWAFITRKAAHTLHICGRVSTPHCFVLLSRHSGCSHHSSWLAHTSR